MSACPACRAEVPDGARFCPACGTRLEADGPEAIERKVVTTLFADLVGFTALGERHDPEDVDAALRGFYALARAIVERYGGGVEKFIGDAVVGLFGVPLAHEDDAERAVRAALELVARLNELPPIGGERLQVRCAVNTGPALVRLHARPETGEGVLVGDAVNTAARLLVEAPPMGVVSGELTRRLSAAAIAYSKLPAVSVKGKASPVERWLACGAVSRRGIDPTRTERAPMIGREVELALLDGLFRRATASGSPQFALVTGEAGLGKTRLVREVFRLVDSRPGFLCTWRQGRCPPYGESLAFWALREIVSDHAGVLPEDTKETVEQKLAKTTGGDDWITARLRPLVGLPSAHADRDESFEAWARYFQLISLARPAVLVVEDLHWASQETLAFLDYLIGHLADAPLLLIATARPEFLDQTESLRDAAVTHIPLTSLDRAECRRLVEVLTRDASKEVVPDEVMSRCGGNPLFAEELVQYLGEAEDPAAGVPDALLSLISARLDSLPQRLKTVVADASVVGEVFWPDAVCVLGDETPRVVSQALDGLKDRGLVGVAADAGRDGPGGLVFRHALIREAAYSRLPRAVRARKHATVADWLQSNSATPAAQLTELLAFHYSTAVQLARAAGEDELAEKVEQPAVLALKRAGDGAGEMDVAAAERYYAHGAAVATIDTATLGQLRLEWGWALVQRGRLQEGLTVLDDAAARLVRLSDKRAPIAQIRASYTRWLLQGRVSLEDLAESLDLTTAAGPTPEALDVLELWVSAAMHSGQTQAALQAADKALELCAKLGAPQRPGLLEYRACVRCDLGDPSGLDDLRSAVALADERGKSRDACAYASNLAEELLVFEGPPAAVREHQAALARAERRHDELARCFCTEGLFSDRVWAGNWQEALADACAIDQLLERHDDRWDLQHFRATLSLLLAWRGDGDAAEEPAVWAERATRETTLLGSRTAALVALAAVRVLQRRPGEAREHLEACAELPPEARGNNDFIIRLSCAARLASMLGEYGLIKRLAQGVLPMRPAARLALQSVEALEAERRGDFEAAAGVLADMAAAWGDLGAPYEQAQALLAQGRCLAGAAEGAAEAVLRDALAMFATLGAAPAARATQLALEGKPALSRAF